MSTKFSSKSVMADILLNSLFLDKLHTCIFCCLATPFNSSKGNDKHMPSYGLKETLILQLLPDEELMPLTESFYYTNAHQKTPPT